MDTTHGSGPEEHKQILSYETAPPMNSPRRIGFLAFGATLFIAGLGHLLAGFWKRGLVWFAIGTSFLAANLLAAAIPAAVPALVVLIPLNAIAQLWMLIDAFRCGRRANAPRLGKPWINLPAGALIILLALFISPVVPIVLLYKNYVTEAFVVPTAGMSPSIAANDHVIVHKRRLPKRWDIIAFDSPETPGARYMQRLVGLPGETIEIKNGVVHVNGQPQQPPPLVGPYAPAPPSDFAPAAYTGGPGRPITLGPDEFFVLGDNSTISLDSRYWSRAAPGHQLGAVPREAIVGVATWIYLPLGHWKRLF